MSIRVWLLATVAIGVATPSFGQSANEELIGEPITVFGGSRDDRQLLETPNSVSIVNETEIRRKQAATYEELLGDVPGLTIDGGPRGIAQEINIRGFTDDQVVLRVDGARQNFNLAHRGRFFTDPEILKQVEVLRGGSSTLFGSGALGGVVSLETKDASDLLDPDDTWGGRVTLGYNSGGDQLLGAATLAGQAGDFDVLGFLSYRPMGSDLEDGAGDPIRESDIDILNGLVKLGYEPGDVRFEISLQRYQDEGVTPAAADDVATVTTTTVVGNPVDRELTSTNARAEVTWDPDNELIDLSALAYFNLIDVTEPRIADGRLNETEFTTIGFEVVNRSDLDFGLPVRMSYGIEAYQDEQKATQNGAPRLSAPDAKAQYASVFMQGDISLTEELTLTPGIRFDYFGLRPDRATFADRDESDFSPKLALQWQPTDEWQLWVSGSRSFRAPSLTELYNDGEHFPIFFPLNATQVPAGVPVGTFLNGNFFVPTPDLEPERSTEVSAGVRFQDEDVAWQGDTLNFSLNGYYAEVDNFIDLVVVLADPAFFQPSGSPFAPNFISGSSTNRNVDATLWGVEAEVSYDNPDFFLGSTLTIPRGKQNGGGNLGSIPQDRLTFTGGVKPLDGLEVGGRVTLLSAQNDVVFAVGQQRTPGTALFDLFLTYDPDSGPLEGTFFAAGIDNVTDRKYRLVGNDLNQPGRTFKVSGGFEF
ncbi:MAG: TonB-dependent hemoglobin/transferrin/lactoferrin family receptor [Pseudomonadota bacterium]